MVEIVGRGAGARFRATVAWASAGVLAVLCLSCSGNDTADVTSGGQLWDGRSLTNWRQLSGSWSVAERALLGGGPRSRLVREARCPASYRLRFEVAPHDSPDVAWAVAFPVGDGCILYKGLFLFAGDRDAWREAWQAVEVEVRRDKVEVSFPGLVERPQEGGRAGTIPSADIARTRKLWKAGFRPCDTRDGLVVIAPPREAWVRDGRSYRAGLARGRRCVEGSPSAIALVVPCVAPGDTDVLPSAGAPFRAIVVEPL